MEKPLEEFPCYSWDQSLDSDSVKHPGTWSLSFPQSKCLFASCKHRFHGLVVTGSSAGAWAGFEADFRCEHHGALGAFRSDEDALSSEGHFHPMATCRWKKLCYVRRANAFYCLCIPAKLFSLSMHPWKVFSLPMHPCPTSLCFPSPFSHTGYFLFSKGKPAQQVFSIKYFSVSFQLLSENPRKNITFNSPPISGAVPGECRCTARVRLIRGLGTQGKACAAWLRASRKYRNKTRSFLASSLIKEEWIVPHSLFSLFSFPCFPLLLPHSCADCESVRFPPPTHKRLLSVPWEYLIFGVCAVLCSSECCQVTWWTVSQDYLMSLQSPHFQSPVIM